MSTAATRRAAGDEGLKNVLLRRCAKHQLRRSRPFLMPGFYETIKGLFVSYPTYSISLVRKLFKKAFLLRVPDNNAFVTFWTLELLLEAQARKAGPLLSIRTDEAVTALVEFHDRTRAQDDPLFVFWKQHRVGKHLAAFPSNLMPFYRLFMLYDAFLKKSRNAFLKIIPPKKDGCASHPAHEPKRSSAAFSLPADFDDSSLNWSLGSCLYGLRSFYPHAWAAWSASGFNFTKLARHAVECSYRPFAEDPDASAIDPRTFYAIRDFLWDIQASGRGSQNFSLLTTWASTTDRNLRGIERYYKMPFNVNNLDCSVQANFIHAACRSALCGKFPHTVQGFEALLANTAEYLAWALTSGTIIDKPDIALLYYPSPYSAFFFISRIVQLLENLRHMQDPAAKPLMNILRTTLSAAARNKITEALLSWVLQTDTGSFWQRPAPEHPESSCSTRLDDRKFLTAASVNCLLNLWTRRSGEAIRWLPSVPADVPAQVQSGLGWLRQHALSRSCSDHNAFFSASVKHGRSLPFLFPATMIQHSEGPALQPRTSTQRPVMSRHSVYAMSGVPTREHYERLLQEKFPAGAEPDAFKKCYELDYPYWSAPSVTNALICLALSKAAALEP